MQYHRKDINKAAKYILNAAGTAKVFAFMAPMGAGKTTLITAICHVLGVLENPSSPSYSIINEYHSSNGMVLFHLDLYRVKDLEEAMQAGVEEVLYRNAFCFVEWPGLIKDILPADTFYIDIKILDQDTREIVFGNTGS